MTSRMRLFGPLLLLLLALAGGGYYNYERNAPLDADLQNRPHATLSTRDLEILYQAHKSELERLTKQLAAKPDGTQEVQNYAPSDVKGKLQSFDRFQSRNKAWQDVYGDKVDQEIALESVEKERVIRQKGLDKRLNQILRRVTTL